MLNIDSSGDVSGVIACNRLYERYKSEYTQEANQNSRFFYLKHDNIPKTNKPRLIQYDKTNCSRFTISALFHLATIDPIPLLEAKKEQFSKSSHHPTEYKFNVTNMPIQMAALYRDMQSKVAFASLPPILTKRIVNKKGQTLIASEKQHTEYRLHDGVIKPTNCSIRHKKKGFVDDTQQFLVSDNMVIQKIENCDALIALERRKFSAKIHSASIVEDLIDEAQRDQKGQGRNKPISHLLQKRKNTKHIKLASKELHCGNPEKALSHLEEIRGSTEKYKAKLSEVKKIGKRSDLTNTPEFTV
ncbi:TPA: hypothetical protein ACTXXA_003701 [Legionella anisa]